MYCPTLNDLDSVTAKSLAEFARKGDKDALSVYKKCGYKLGEGLSIIIDILNPEVIVIGSVFARSGDLLIPYMNKAIEKEAIKASADVCKIVPAVLGESIGDVASLICAEEGVKYANLR
jgi:glucokinase